MKIDQARGYVFEKIIQELLSQSGYYDVKSEKIQGRGADHQIDAYGVFSYPVPYIYPIRIISEVKCYKRETIGLPQIRDFVGVMKDISECYFMVNGEGNQENRYNDIGCYFSYTDFTRDAQEYAWAQNIFLVSFYKNRYILNIVREIDSLLKEYAIGGKIDLSKDKLVEVVETKLSSEKLRNLGQFVSPDELGLRDSVNLVSLRIGVLDNRYPVILVGPKDWDKKISIPSYTDSIEVMKSSRKDNEESSMFSLQLEMGEVLFSLPKGIRDYLISIIDRSESGQHICTIDLPVVNINLNNEDNKNGVRRILSLEVKL